ncbi:MAG: integration host factor subunit alpha [Desulfuromonadaceae bacterium]|nr:integration host factor subunit alpha [Desulfuromonadaceae bacterium]
MTKIDIVEKISNQLGFTKKAASDYLESVFALMKETLASGEDIKISGFGKFEIKKKKDRRGRNPATGDSIIIEARKILTYKSSTLLKARING